MINEGKALEIGRRVLSTEISALESTKDILDDVFITILNELERCRGKVVITGMGKSGHVARKIAATMSSLGIASFFLHPGEAMHGDLGMVQSNDIVIAISYSGESEEIVKILPNLKMIGAKVIGITSNINSTLAKKSDIVQCFSNMKEACHLGLAPTTSTTVVMAYGDALAVTLSELKGFSKNNFALFHPAGSLGKKLTIKVTDLMKTVEKENCVTVDSLLEECIIKQGRLGTELLTVMNEKGKLFGIITNGDIERAISQKENIYQRDIRDMVNCFPVYVEADTMAVDALQIMMQHNIRSMPVVRDECVIGIIAQEKIIRRGIYI